MIIFPAIDILGGKCVRLYKGDYQKSTVVADSAESTALEFKRCGATHMHMVDLDGAKDGRRINHGLISRTVKSSGLKVQVGGGIRTIEAAQSYIDAGAHRIIIGSAAADSPKFVEQAVARLGQEHVAVGIDAKGGVVMTQGWLSSSGITYTQLIERMCSIGVRYFIVTDIDRDGTLSGISQEMLHSAHSSNKGHIIASGGVKDIGDIKAAKQMGLYGVICGKAIYSGSLDLKQAILIAGK